MNDANAQSPIGWDDLQNVHEEGEEPLNGLSGVRHSFIWDVVTMPVPMWVAWFSALLGGVAVLLAAFIVSSIGSDRPPVTQAMAASAPTVTLTPSATPTPTPTVAPSPTPVPTLTVWSPAGDCAYVRPTPAGDSKPIACLRNGTRVKDLGKRAEGNGYKWAQIQFFDKSGLHTGWMALGVVVWDFAFDHRVGGKPAPLYNTDKTTIRSWLSPYTPLAVLQQEGKWAWVQLPNLVKGWVKVKDLKP